MCACGRFYTQAGDSHVGQGGAEVLVDVGFQDGIEVLELDVSDESDDENLKKKTEQNVSEASKLQRFISTINS